MFEGPHVSFLEPLRPLIATAIREIAVHTKARFHFVLVVCSTVVFLRCLNLSFEIGLVGYSPGIVGEWYNRNQRKPIVCPLVQSYRGRQIIEYGYRIRGVLSASFSSQKEAAQSSCKHRLVFHLSRVPLGAADQADRTSLFMVYGSLYGY